MSGGGEIEIYIETVIKKKGKGLRLLWRRGYRLITFNAALCTGLDYVDWIYVVQHWPIVEWHAVVKTVMNF